MCFQVGFDVGWELDLWGRVRRSVESADANVRLSEQDLRDAQLSLVGEVVRGYLELRGVQDQLRIANAMAVIRGGLIQMSLKGDTSMSPEKIRDKMLEAHLPLIEKAAKQKVQVLCFQEVFTQPYFCPSQDKKWYRATEKIPDGPTTRLMQKLAKKHGMVHRRADL